MNKRFMQANGDATIERCRERVKFWLAMVQECDTALARKEPGADIPGIMRLHATAEQHHQWWSELLSVKTGLGHANVMEGSS